MADGGGRKSVGKRQTPPQFHFTAALINGNVSGPEKVIGMCRRGEEERF